MTPLGARRLHRQVRNQPNFATGQLRALPSVRQRRAIHSRRTPCQLAEDVESDSHESTDLASEPEHASRVMELTELMSEQQRAFGDTAPLTIQNPQRGDVDLKFFEQALQ